ncbi:MAG: hypothetical protein N3F08_05155 [Crenarchaeota archaeon]|nr:hypothetical protein [Thermoproteota archaeon]
MGGNVRLVLALALLPFLLTGFLKASATPFELSYDDGGHDYGWSDFYPNGAAVMFSPPSPAWRITAVKIYATCILRGPSSLFYVQIWDAGLNTVYSEPFIFNRVFRNATLDWYTIRVPNVVVKGVFHVVIIPMFTLDGPQLWLGVDDDPPIANNSFIMDVDKHAPLVSLNASSGRPGDFMVRVVGEPTEIPHELRLASIELSEKETIIVFNYPGEVKGFGARLVRVNGDHVDCNASRVTGGVMVRVGESGFLNVYVETPRGEVVGVGLRINASLRMLYQALHANYTVLKESSEWSSRKLETLSRENENLKTQLREWSNANSVLQKQVWTLMGNLTAKEQRVSELNSTVGRLENEKTILLILLAAAIIVPPAILTFKRRRPWK